MRHSLPKLTLVALVASSTIAFAVAPAPDDGRTTTGPDLETVPYMATDQAGDANAINDQGLPFITGTPPATSTDPASVPHADILGARITSLYEEVVGQDGLTDHVLTGLEFRTGITAEPAETTNPLIHRFMGSTGGCEFWVQAYTGTGGAQAHGSADVRAFDGCGYQFDADDPLDTDRTISDGVSYSYDSDHGELVVTLTLDQVDPTLATNLERGEFYLLGSLHNRSVTNAVAISATIPQFDEMPGENGFTEIGSDIPADEEPPPDDGGGDGGSDDGGDSDIDADGHRGGDGNDVPRDTRPVCERFDGEATGTTPTEGHDRTGAEGSTLTVGLHAPATGAAPVPTTSYDKGRDLYWAALAEGCEETVLGRDHVEVLFRDDRYDPNSAGQVCKELASEAFMVVGAAGTDQIQRCGQIAGVNQFPYLSTGVTEAGLEHNPWYFASTMSFREQGGLLADYVTANPDDNRVLGAGAQIGSIVTNTPNYDDALEGWRQGLRDNDQPHLTTFRYTKGDTSWYADTARQFRADGVEVVYFLGSPVDLLTFAQEANDRFDYNPLYIGVATDTSLDAVLRAGCREPGQEVDGAVWLSHTPGLDDAPSAFLDAAAQFSAPADQISLRLWAFAEQQHELLAGYGDVHGEDLTRPDFRAYVEDGTSSTNGTFPDATWSPSDHFPSEAMHVVQANCEREEHVTLHVDASGF